MKLAFKLFIFSTIIVFIAWIAKMHFIFGGDHLFRIGTFGILISIIVQIILFTKNIEIKSNNLTRLFILNSISLEFVYLGMMMKVSHIMNSQFEKDFVMDFIGIPAILTAVIYNFVHIEKLIESSKNSKLLFYRQILLPWSLFLCSFLLYAIYSVILTNIDVTN